ncbi:hypothetical protein ACIGO6_22880 [Streptomyces sp. NPDC053750]|uniref:hypothetical protein n=1 Tax=Streptomyces sp. NPDC053750 TaxID=3365714 RepID=UPI0037D21437
MADEQDRWLDRETAELLLRGESPQPVDPVARDRAERLVEALGALSAPPVPTSGELPGEAAALAAFRTVRAERADVYEGAPDALGHGPAARSSDVALVRIGARGDAARGPRRRSPLRVGLVAALTVGMIGGVAVAAGTGALPGPFDRAEPDPAATVSAGASPGHPRASPSPLDGVQGGSTAGGIAPGTGDRGTAGDSGRGSEEGSREASGRGSAKGRADEGTTRDRDSDDRGTGGSDGRRPGLATSCRAVRAGGELDGTMRRALKDAAGGASRVAKYCKDLLARTDAGESSRERSDGKTAGDRDEEAGKDGKDDEDGKGAKGGKDGKDGEGDRDGRKRKGGDGDDRHPVTPVRPAR